MKYKCQICGYVYDEEAEGVKFTDLPADWKCPWCGASKSDFAPEHAPGQTATANAGGLTDETAGGEDSSSGRATSCDSETFIHHEERRLSTGQLAAICSNLARGCEKQYRSEEQARFMELARWFDNITPEASESGVDELLSLIDMDLKHNYPSLSSAGTAEGDRGALRVKVWGEKVSMIQKSLLERYRRDGEQFLENTEIWICTVCGFIFVGDKAPAICPVCKVPDWKFEKVNGR
ncbi:MAG: rubredoxin [Bacteroidales bacterium]|nr:rubredoxin [Bacteroidales bacterium]